MWYFMLSIVWSSLLQSADTTCQWNKIQRGMKCDLRTLDYKRDLTLEHQEELERTATLNLTCSDVFFFESHLRSDHFGSLQELRKLDIEHCKIRTLPPRSFVGLSNLQELSIQTFNSDWSEVLLQLDYEAFVGLDKLELIKLSYNNIYELPARLFCPLSSLQTIELNNNQLVNLEDLGLSNRSASEQCRVSITKLDVSFNRLGSVTPGSLSMAADSLQTLIVSNNALTVLDRMTFHGLTSLSTLDLSHNGLAALPPDLFLDNAGLQQINLANNSLGTVHLSVFRNLTKLRVLNLSHNALDENWLKEDIFSDLTSLTSLDLSHNHLSHVDNTLLQTLTRLTHLDLSHNRLVSIGSQVLSHSAHLKHLNMANNQLEAVSKTAFSSCSRLVSLELSSNKLQSLHEDIFRNLTNLSYLALSRNQLSQLPSSMSDLKKLNHLDVSVNIIGVISPKDIRGINNLTFLNLSSNDISRINGATFNETPSLQYLDLSKNRLQALNQTSFAALGNLTHLDLAENQLEDINGLLTTQMRLEHLNISSNRLHWFDYAFVPNSLKVLDIHDNLIDSIENYYSLRDGFQLEFLDASRNRIRALGVLSLLPSLQTIILKNNKISDIGHNTFLNKENLTRVDLRHNRISVLNIAALAVSTTVKNERATFLMSENPFHCSCDMQWMVNPGYNDRLPFIEDLEEVECLVNYYGNNTAIAKMATVPSNQFLCEYESHCFSLCMCCDFFGCDCRMQCPDGCSCFHDSTWSSNIIQCSARAHTDVPPLIPMDATSVFLDGNMMADLTGQIFLGRSRMKNLYLNASHVTTVSNNTFVGLQDLQLLDLSNNLLAILDGLEFGDLVNLRELYLHNNKIVHISPQTFGPLKSLSVLRLDNNLLTTFPVWQLSHNPFLVGLYLANNVWTCECEFVSNFRMFIDGNLDKVMDARDVHCIVNSLMDEAYSQSGRNCVETTNAAFRTHSSSDHNATAIIIGCCIMLLAIVFLIFAMYKMQDTLMLWAHAKYGLRIPSKNLAATNNDKLFDAYFTYCLKDDQCVSQIARELHDYRLCLHQQNLLGNNRNPAEAALSAAKASARTVIVMSKAFLASEWDGIKSFLLSPESGDISKSVIIILLDDMKDYENIQNFEVKTFINSCQHKLRWQESKFWAKLKFLLPDPLGSNSLDKTALTQLDSSQQLWSPLNKEMPDSGVSSAHISQMSLTQTGTNTRSESLRFKSKSRQSIPSTVESNNEFIYLTPKPKKAQRHSTVGQDDGLHQRSSSEVHQPQPQYTYADHQRSKSTVVPAYSGHNYYDQAVHSVQPIQQHMNQTHVYNQIDHQQQPVYGSTSFIYKLIQSHDTPTLPMSDDRYGGQYGGQYNVAQQQHRLSYHPPPQRASPQQQQQQYSGRSSATLSAPQRSSPHGQHRRDGSHPGHLLPGGGVPHHPAAGASPHIHHRSKSSPYNGFVV